MFYEMIKGYYEDKMEGYDNEGMKVFVEANMITAEQYKEITGMDYIA
ncbi:XkdX family protein [Romboutsia sp. 1001216sp1]|nr:MULTISPECIES: XkdX family protein [unclassified Romboutsia]MDB8790678.1 XkdX family protein [Romboutsia sp. 1001216sp1]MDB8803241.1 XkdX family protein [Romboutsia sp. 1001216sp1]MDB8814595.1 XkdX family protein [Romboutsia sp. 1001216sp1]